MTYPISKTHSLTPVPVNIPGGGTTTIPGSTTYITLPGGWSGYRLLNISTAYDATTDNLLMIYTKHDGSTYWEIEAVAFGPMTSDTPTFGPILAISTAGAVPLFLGISSDARIAFEQEDMKIFKFSIDGSKNVTETHIDVSGWGSTSSIDYILPGPLGDIIKWDISGVTPVQTFEVLTSSISSPINQDTGYCISGNNKYINLTYANGLRYVTSFTSLAYSTAATGSTSTSFNKLCYDNNRKEVLAYIDNSTNGSVRAYNVDVSTPVLAESTTIPLTWELRDIYFNKYIKKYVYAAAELDGTKAWELGVLNRKDGGFVIDSTVSGTGSISMHQHSVISEGKWAIYYMVNDSLPTTIKFYKIA